MILTLLWGLLSFSIVLAFVSAYFYWFSGNTTIQGMLGFYIGTFFSITFFVLILILKSYYFLA